MAFHQGKKRKSRHLQACLDPSFSVERADTRLKEISLIPRALPEISLSEVSTATRFFNRVVSLPLFILPMTGGTRRGKMLNRELALAAEQENIAVGMGSMRILLEDHRRIADFSLRSYAPSVPLVANISAVQLRQYGIPRIIDLCRKLEVDGLSIHLNTLQEYFQTEGERDFRELFAIIAECTKHNLPLMVKETGFGMRPSEILRLRESGVHYVDISAAGGTNWALVEGYRQNREHQRNTEAFASWGLPSGMLLLLLERKHSGIIASGGIRRAMDVPIALALGAEMVGMALPFLQAAYQRGAEGISELIQHYRCVLQAAMLATGVRRISELSSVPIQVSDSLLRETAYIRDQLHD